MMPILRARVARFGVTKMQKSLWLCALGDVGKSVALVELDDGHAEDYARLCDWLATMLPPRYR